MIWDSPLCLDEVENDPLTAPLMGPMPSEADNSPSRSLALSVPVKKLVNVSSKGEKWTMKD